MRTIEPTFRWLPTGWGIKYCVPRSDGGGCPKLPLKLQAASSITPAPPGAVFYRKVEADAYTSLPPSQYLCPTLYSWLCRRKKAERKPKKAKKRRRREEEELEWRETEPCSSKQEPPTPRDSDNDQEAQLSDAQRKEQTEKAEKVCSCRFYRYPGRYTVLRGCHVRAECTSCMCHSSASVQFNSIEGCKRDVESAGGAVGRREESRGRV